MIKLQTKNSRKGGKATFAIVSIIVVFIFFGMFVFNISSLIRTQTPNELNLKLPKSDANPIAVSTISVSVTENGIFYVNEEEVNVENLRNKISERIQNEEEPENVTIMIDAEVGTPVEHVVAIMDVARILKVGAVLSSDEKE